MTPEQFALDSAQRGDLCVHLVKLSPRSVQESLEFADSEQELLPLNQKASNLFRSRVTAHLPMVGRGNFIVTGQRREAVGTRILTVEQHRPVPPVGLEPTLGGF